MEKLIYDESNGLWYKLVGDYNRLLYFRYTVHLYLYTNSALYYIVLVIVKYN